MQFKMKKFRNFVENIEKDNILFCFNQRPHILVALILAFADVSRSVFG